MISFVVNDEFNLFRLDKFLCKKFNISFALAQKLIRTKKIKINHQKPNLLTKINIGDQITIYENISPRDINLTNPAPIISVAKEQKFWQNIIFEDENLIAINKPSGLATQGGSGIEISVDDFVKLKKYHLVHRLDKDTSGILLIAKNSSTVEFLTNGFKNKTIHKTYIALVYGILKKTSGTIEIPLSKQSLGKIEKVQPDFEFGKTAITHYKLISQHKNYCKVELKPITGRTHQLRVHCKEIGHPILNDIKYGGKKVNFKNFFSRLCLHAVSIEIENYLGKNLIIEANNPKF